MIRPYRYTATNDPHGRSGPGRGARDATEAAACGAPPGQRGQGRDTGAEGAEAVAREADASQAPPDRVTGALECQKMSYAFYVLLFSTR